MKLLRFVFICIFMAWTSNSLAQNGSSSHKLSMFCRININDASSKSIRGSEFFSGININTNLTKNELAHLIKKSFTRKEYSELINAKRGVRFDIVPYIDSCGNIAGYQWASASKDSVLALISEESYLRLLCNLKDKVRFGGVEFMHRKGILYLEKVLYILVDFADRRMTVDIQPFAFKSISVDFKPTDTPTSKSSWGKIERRAKDNANSYDISSNMFVVFDDEDFDTFDLSYDRYRFMTEGRFVKDTSLIENNGISTGTSETYEVITAGHPHDIQGLSSKVDVVALASSIKDALEPDEFSLLCNRRCSLYVPYSVVDVEGNVQAMNLAHVTGPSEAIRQISKSSLINLFSIVKRSIKYNDGGIMKEYGAQYYSVFRSCAIKFSEKGVTFEDPVNVAESVYNILR